MQRSSPPREPRPRLLALALAGALAAGAVMAESGTVLKGTELRREPLGSAEVLAELRAKESVEITARQGAWAGVRTEAGVEGWARILNLRTGSAVASAAAGGNPLSVFATGSRGSSVSTGVKGLSAEELMSASANHAEVALLDEYAASAGEANGFAAEVPLATNEVAYLEPDRRSRRRNR
jgi:hypothetical protein